MNNIDEVEKEIKKILQQIVIASNKVTKQEKDSNAWWTKAVKNGLCGLAHNMKYAVTANGCDADDKEEWLLDIIWPPKKEFNEIILAMECECSTDKRKILDDFEKLLVIRSKYRVFIFNQYERDQISDLIEKFREKITNFKSTLSGDRYLLPRYCVDEEDFIFNNTVVP